MTDESSSSPPTTTADTSNSTTTAPTIAGTTWSLPVGIEEDIEQALFKTTVGALAGGVVGLLCFKGGKGSRAASIAAGIGAGLGSTWERSKFRYDQQTQESK